MTTQGKPSARVSLQAIEEEIKRCVSELGGRSGGGKQSQRSAELNALEAELFGGLQSRGVGLDRDSVTSKKYLGVHITGQVLPGEILQECIKNSVSEADFTKFLGTYCTDVTTENYWRHGTSRFEDFIQNFTTSSQASTHIWIDGLIYPGSSADINLNELNNLLSVIGSRTNFSVHLLGHGITPDYVHPKWVSRYGNRLPAGFLVYKGGQKRVDVTLHFDGNGRKVLYGMKFTPSNFIEYKQTVHLGRDLGIVIHENSELQNTLINTTEKLIQLPKNIASTMEKYGHPDFLTENRDILEQAIPELNPKTQKKFGRAARLSKDGVIYILE
jgi:hypothetical protein